MVVRGWIIFIFCKENSRITAALVIAYRILVIHIKMIIPVTSTSPIVHNVMFTNHVICSPFAVYWCPELIILMYYAKCSSDVLCEQGEIGDDRNTNVVFCFGPVHSDFWKAGSLAIFREGSISYDCSWMVMPCSSTVCLMLMNAYTVVPMCVLIFANSMFSSNAKYYSGCSINGSKETSQVSLLF